MGKSDENICSVCTPTRREFSRPFSEYLGRYFEAQPDCAMVKVVPPKGWKPRASSYPRLETLQVRTPIQQNALGQKGTFRCFLVEQKDINAKEYKELALSERYSRPKRCRGVEESKSAVSISEQMHERAFWSTVTTNPPIYGADTAQSLFDDELDWGWNLRNLGCLLKQQKIASIPGVTAPMTYFGMWKAFFTWHVEDADLYSINYHHFGEPKVWYCVSPKHRKKFEEMAATLFPDLSKACKAFLRHKDILLSPNVLNTFHIPYSVAVQKPGEFIVLNAGAYHAGYNLGYNCAEAINFALDQWLEIGKQAVACTCGMLKDGVRIDMDLFNESCQTQDKSPLEERSEEDQSNNKKRKKFVVRISTGRLKTHSDGSWSRGRKQTHNNKQDFIYY
eukprot:TRINITY_DN9052_c1_g1_i2.p2 TRINITY_DN9052_c1_g1~~TRINITY_DN9052_c1_g1_i2.p2  ORF type:complete len:392 (+),score=27.34 TRINITY_DN9052_c1_g1_i2:164-1339(+)